MWPLVVVLLLCSASSGSAQLIFKQIKSAEYTNCNKTVVIPCFATNVEAQNLNEMFVRWKFGGKDIFVYDGDKNKSNTTRKFSSASIEPNALLRGIASLKMDPKDAVLGNYTCEVTELSREGEIIIDLKHRVGIQIIRSWNEFMAKRWRQPVSFHRGLDKDVVHVLIDYCSAIRKGAISPCVATWMDLEDIMLSETVSWFTPNENILAIIFPMLAVLLFWGQFGIVRHWLMAWMKQDRISIMHYFSLLFSLLLALKFGTTKERTILLFVAGLVLTTIVVVGAILFIPGEYSTKRATGLGLIVVPTVILILLQYSVFTINSSTGMTTFSIAILVIQVLGFVLSVVGLSLCVSECTSIHGPLLLSGLGVVALAELLGLVYMKFNASNQRTIQPPRKAVEEPLNAFKESKGMMNDEYLN